MSSADDPGALVAEARAIEKRWAKYCGAIGHQQPEMLLTIANDALPLLARLADALDLVAVRAEAAALREGLLSLERVTEDGGGWEYCAVCQNWMSGHPNPGHTQDCRLARILTSQATPPEEPARA